MNNETRSVTDARAEALKEAGYTPLPGAILFCLLVAALGGVMGSIFLAIAFNALFGVEQENVNGIAGAVVGALAAGGLALSKVWQGNLEAREKVDDSEWRRLSRELHARMPRSKT